MNYRAMESAYCSGDECLSDCSDHGHTLGTMKENTKTEEFDVEVAIIGNGPAAICLSMLLSGYIPYFSGKHPDPLLTSKLNENPHQSLLEQDLQYLSEGLEGRSKNPVALLFDTLFHPNADLGEDNLSTLRWTKDESAACSHIVIGTEQPGGQWHIMEKSILTLSLDSWLELPMYTFKEWKKMKGKSIIDERLSTPFFPKKHYADKIRAAAGDAAEYYIAYVEKMGLKSNFMSGMLVHHVEKIEKSKVKSTSPVTTNDTLHSPKEESHKDFNNTDSCVDKGVVCPTFNGCSQWKLKAKRVKPEVYKTQVQVDSTSENIVIKARNVVLACGLGAPSKLGVPGEDLPYVMDFLQFQERMEHIKSLGQPVAVIGAGMSGADTALLCLENNIPLYHIFKQTADDDNLMVVNLTPGMYQEYHYLARLMKGKQKSSIYTPFSQHQVKAFHDNGRCVLLNLKDSTSVEINVCGVIVMVGYEADLNFLPEDIKKLLPLDPKKPVHNKRNTLDVDMYSFRSDAFPTLYALGPLTGDNFVRFVFGSALGTAQSILKMAPACPRKKRSQSINLQ